MLHFSKLEGRYKNICFSDEIDTLSDSEDRELLFSKIPPETLIKDMKHVFDPFFYFRSDAEIKKVYYAECSSKLLREVFDIFVNANGFEKFNLVNIQKAQFMMLRKKSYIGEECFSIGEKDTTADVWVSICDGFLFIKKIKYIFKDSIFENYSLNNKRLFDMKKTSFDDIKRDVTNFLSSLNHHINGSAKKIYNDWLSKEN